MLLGIVTLAATIFATNGLPHGIGDLAGNYHIDAQFPEYQAPHPSDSDFLDFEANQAGFHQVPDFGQVAFDQAVFDQSAFEHGGFVHDATFETGDTFTLSCTGENRACVDKHLCVNGYFKKAQLYQPVRQQCNVNSEVCCTLVQEVSTPKVETVPDVNLEEGAGQGGVAQEAGTDAAEGGVQEAVDQSSTVDQTLIQQGADQTPETAGEENSGAPVAGSANTDFLAFATPSACAAALLCVEDRFCTLEGMITKQPIELTEKLLLRRVALSTCKIAETGTLGKCCRDPDYVDPWPTGNLPANYSGGFDEQGFPTFLNIAKVRPPTKVNPKPVPQIQQVPTVQNEIIVPPSVETVENVDLPLDIASSVNNLETVSVGLEGGDVLAGNLGRCGVKNKMPRKPEIGESETVFAEIPWQAMVLHARDRKILCSGALIGVDSVLTAANCVDRLSANDVSIKLGEWKLGSESPIEEPLPFEILNVSSIRMHPNYAPGQARHDLALLKLNAEAKLDFHVNPLCLPETDYVGQESRRCIGTGWGKSILQAHYEGAIMHAVDLNVISTEDCKYRLLDSGLRQDVVESSICAKTRKEKNNVCEADVGGPLACENENGLFELAGIYSQDSGCLSTNQVAVFAPVDEQWIRNSMFVPKPEENPYVLPEETERVEIDGIVESSNDYRESQLSTDNQYLPPN